MMTEPNTAQSIVDGQLAELQITSTEVTGDTYKEQHDAKIKALAEEEAALPIPKDKATLQMVQDFITKSEKARTGIDKWRKAFKDKWKKIIDPVDAYIGTNKESGMQARIYAIQERAEAKKKAYLDEQAKAAREAERLLEERYTGRVAKLIAAGMVQQADTLVIEHDGQTMSALLSQVRFATDEQMTTVVLKVHAIAAQKETAALAAAQAKEAEERERVEEANRLAAQKAEQEAEAAKLKAEREAFEREKAEMRKEKGNRRATDLVDIGASWRKCGDVYIREFCTTQGRLADMTDEEFQQVKQFVRDACVKDKQEYDEQAKAEAERAEQAAKVEPVPTEPDNTVLVTYPEPVFETIAELTRPEPVKLSEDPDVLAVAKLLEEPLTIESAIFQALGEASMCWDPRPTGIFDSTRCKDVGERLITTLQAIAAK